MAREWTRNECEAIVSDYFDMLAREVRGEAFKKSEYRKNLRTALNDRSDGSIEYKHQNISAVLIRAGQVYVQGYKPAWNYQLLLEEVVLSQLEQRDVEITALEDALLEESTGPVQISDWSSYFVDPPVKMDELRVQERGPRKPRITNYSEREARNRKLGSSGEAFVLKLEHQRLLSMGRRDLASEIQWTSKERGDGTGYDIRSFRGNTDEELFIEVKTTNSGKFQPFLISTNEVEFSNEFADKYSLYRLFAFSRSPHVFELKGSVDQHVNLAPKLYSAIF